MSALRAIRRLKYLVYDRLGLLMGQRDELTPPHRLLQHSPDGSRDLREYVWIGEGIARHVIGLGLQPHHHVLDIGSGNGRVAIPMAKYLNDGGRYEGIDIVSDSVAWCNQTIASHFPNTRFNAVDIYSEYYNPQGRHRVTEYRFPCADGAFDFIIAMSLFTHMLPDGMQHYFDEMSRVLKPQGKSVMTFFLLDPETRSAADELGLPVEYSRECLIGDTSAPERIVAYDESYVRSLCERQKFTIESISHGSWAGKGDPAVVGLHDCLVMVKD